MTLLQPLVLYVFKMRNVMIWNLLCHGAVVEAVCCFIVSPDWWQSMTGAPLGWLLVLDHSLRGQHTSQCRPFLKKQVEFSCSIVLMIW